LNHKTGDLATEERFRKAEVSLFEGDKALGRIKMYFCLMNLNEEE